MALRRRPAAPAPRLGRRNGIVGCGALAFAGDSPPPAVFRADLAGAAGEYHGFFWRYFVNEHLLRYLGLRYPQDYDTVPLAAFWLGHLIWLFPWSAYAPAVRGLAFGSGDRASARA